MALDQPGGVVDLAERQQRLTQFLDGLESPHPRQSKILGDNFEDNAYEVLEIGDMDEDVCFVTNRNLGCILLVISSLAATCNTARQIRQHTSTKIIAFSTIPVIAAETSLYKANATTTAMRFSHLWVIVPGGIPDRMRSATSWRQDQQHAVGDPEPHLTTSEAVSRWFDADGHTWRDDRGGGRAAPWPDVVTYLLRRALGDLFLGPYSAC